MQGDDPPYLPVGTDVSAKYKGAFCEAKVSKVVRVVKLKVTYKSPGLGSATLSDEQVRTSPGVPLRVGQVVQARHTDKKEYIDATITKIQDCSQYTVVFDDGDITTLRRTALCLKSGRHFNESETLDQLPLTHPEHFGNPVVGGRRGRRSRQLKEDSSDGEDADDDAENSDRGPGGSGVGGSSDPTSSALAGKDVGRVVCVETSEGKRKGAAPTSGWFPGLVVSPTAQAAVRINTRDECLIRSFKDGRYYTVPRKEITEFKRDDRVDSPPLAEAVDKALNYLDKAELPQHWDKDTLFGMNNVESDSDDNYTDSSDDEPREEKDHFVAQLYKFMDDRGTPLNKGPVISNRDVDLCRLFRIVHKLGGYNRVTNKNKWRAVTIRLGFSTNGASTTNLVKQAYKKFLFSFEDFNRKLGCTMVPNPRSNKKNRGRSLIRDRDRMTPIRPATASPRPETKSVEEVTDSQKPEKEKKEEPPIVSQRQVEKDKIEETPKRRPIKLKEDQQKLVIKKEPVARDVSSDGSSSDGTIDVVSDVPGPTVKKGQETVQKREPKKVETKSTVVLKERRVKPAAGEKVKALIEKFEDVKAEEKDEDKVQQTRSKSAGAPRKVDNTRVTVSPDRKVRETRTPIREIAAGRSASTGTTSKPLRGSRLSADDEKKRGRKRKDTGDDKSQGNESSSSEATLPPITNVNVGDKLKVYYGPNLESKVTYEAKVLEIEKDDSGPLYLVHYTGWNTRYDEWIKPNRIADNVSQNTKAKRLGKSAAAAGAKAAVPSKPPAAKRGRGTSVSSRTNQDAPPRSTTPSSVTSSSGRTKSPATPASRAPSARLAKQAETAGRRMVRRASTATDSDSFGSESDDMPKRRNSKRKEEVLDGMGDEDSADKPKRVRKTPKKEPIGKVSSTSIESDDDGKCLSSAPKGRDFDLNQIRSELKGFDKITVPSQSCGISSESESVTPLKTKLVPVAPEVKVVTTKTKTEPKEAIKTETSTESDKEKSTDDIYEFKEPEPFEFESRSKINDDKLVKKRLVPRIFEDIEKTPEKTPPKKKTAKTSPKTESKTPDSDSKKSRFRRNLDKKPEETEPVIVPLISKSPIKSEQDSPKPHTTEDAFDKLVESPSFNIGASPEVKKSPTDSIDAKKFSPSSSTISLTVGSTCTSILDKDSLKLNLDEPTTFEEPSNLFQDLPETEESDNINVSIETDSEVDRPFARRPDLFSGKLTSLFTDKDSSEPPTLVPIFEGFNDGDMTACKSPKKDENSDDEDLIHAAIQRVIAQPDEDSNDDQLLSQSSVSSEINLITYRPKLTEVKKDASTTVEQIPKVECAKDHVECNLLKDTDSLQNTSSIKETSAPQHITNPVMKEIDEVEEVDKKNITESEKNAPEIKKEISIDESNAIVESTFVVKTEPIEQKPHTSIKKEEKVAKQISPALQETDSSLLEAAINRQKVDLVKVEPIDINIKTGTKIADSILQKFNMIKNEGQVKKEEKSPIAEKSVEIKSEVKTLTKNVEPQKLSKKEESKEPSLLDVHKKRTVNKKAISREFIESDTDNSDSEERLIIARSDEDSQTSRGDSCSNLADKVDSKDTDSDASALRINTDESSQDVKETRSNFEPDSTIINVTEAKNKEEIDQIESKCESKEEEHDGNVSLLLCEETIPGSPAPVSDPTVSSQSENHVISKQTKSIVLEMPFASAPGSSNSKGVSTELPKPTTTARIDSKPVNVVEPQPVQVIGVVIGGRNNEVRGDDAAPVMDNTPPTTPESTLSNLSPRGEHGGSSPGTADESNKSQRGSEASEVEPFSSRTTKPQNYSEEDTLTDTTPLDIRAKKSPRNADETISNLPGRKRRKSFKGNPDDIQVPSVTKRGRRPNALKNITRAVVGNNSDSDDTSEHSSATSNTIPLGPPSALSTNSNSADNRLMPTHPRSASRSSKFNFIVELGPDLDGNQRIAVLQQKLSELRKAYNEVKNELACIDRRRKKLRRREREENKWLD